jgi:hypothetical protein
MLVVDVVDNRTQERLTIPVEQYEAQRNTFNSSLKDAIYVAVNNVYYEMPEAPVEQEAAETESSDPVYAEWVALQAKSKEISYPKLSGEEKARYQELKTLFQAE